MGSCFADGDYRRKEETLFKRIKEVQTSLEDMTARCAATEYALNNSKAEWMAKENDYLQQLNDLQDRLHQQDVICKQYQIYEKNLENDRQTMIELQTDIEQLRKKNSSHKVTSPSSATQNDESTTSSSATTCPA